MEIVHLTVQTMDSPLGPLTIAESEKGIFSLDFDKGEHLMSEVSKGRLVLRFQSLEYPVIQQVKEYFHGERREFSLPLHFEGTSFQKKVWTALCTVPYGQTRSYRQIGEQIGCAKGARAVGQANSRNPLPILVPCHRIIAADGTLGGYTGGLHIKTTLLELEKEYR